MQHKTLMILIATLCTLVAAHTRADSRVTVHDFFGPSAARMRNDVVSVLERQSGLTIVSKGEVTSAARRLGLDSFSPDGRQMLARELNLSAWMSGLVERRNGKLQLTVVVYDGAQHMRVARARLTGNNLNNLRSAIRDQLWDQSGRAIMEASGPEPARALAADKSGTSDMVISQAEADHFRDTSEPEQTTRRGGNEALRAYLGVGSPYRSLDYREPVTSTLGDYQLSSAALADIHVAFHPARFVTDGWPSWLGLDAAARITISAPTLNNNGDEFTSRYDGFRVGLRARVPLGRHSVSAFSGYAMSRYAITGRSRDISAPVPSVDYRSIRSGLGGEFALSDALGFGVDAAWLDMLSVGDIGKWFPRATAGGLELAMFATYQLSAHTFAQAAAAYQRTFFDFHSRVDDKNVAGGATDQSLTISLGMGLAL